MTLGWGRGFPCNSAAVEFIVLLSYGWIPQIASERKEKEEGEEVFLVKPGGRSMGKSRLRSRVVQQSGPVKVPKAVQQIESTSSYQLGWRRVLSIQRT